MKIANVKISGRARVDLGDVNSLARSIETVGLLHPIVVTSDGTLIAGARRIAAFAMLGRDEIPHTVADSLQDGIALLKAERDENDERKNFTPSESVALADRLGPLEKKEAEKRRRGGQKRGRDVQKGVVAKKSTTTDKVRAADKIAVAVGMSRTTYAKAKAVVQAARNDPEKFGPIKDEMDRTGNVHGAFKSIARTALKQQLRQMAKESQEAFEKATAWMSDEQKAMLSTEMQRQRGEFMRLTKDLVERSLLDPEEFASTHLGYLTAETIATAKRAYDHLGRFLQAWKAKQKSADHGEHPTLPFSPPATPKPVKGDASNAVTPLANDCPTPTFKRTPICDECERHDHERVQVRCPNHPALFFETKNIAPIGCRTIWPEAKWEHFEEDGEKMIQQLPLDPSYEECKCDEDSFEHVCPYQASEGGGSIL